MRFAPHPIVNPAPNISNSWYRIGVKRALGGAQGFLAVSPVELNTLVIMNGVQMNIDITAPTLVIPIQMNGVGNGEGYASYSMPIANNPSLAGMFFAAQWFIADPGVANGISASHGHRIPIF